MSGKGSGDGDDDEDAAEDNNLLEKQRSSTIGQNSLVFGASGIVSNANKRTNILNNSPPLSLAL